MAEIKSFNRSTIRDVRDAFQRALQQVEAEYGLKIEVGGARFSETNVTFKVEAAVVNADGEALSRDAQTFQQLATAYGLKPEDLGKTFSVGRTQYTIKGLKATRPKFPISAVDQNGRPFKLPIATVKRGLGYPVSIEDHVY